MKKLTALVLALALALSVSLAFAGQVEPEVHGVKKLSDTSFNATVGEYDPNYKTFTLYVTAAEQFKKADVEKLAVGDTLVVGGWPYKVQEIKETDGYKVYVTDDFGEIYFDTLDEVDSDHLVARSLMNGKVFSNVVTILYLKATEDMVFEDDSEPDLNAQMKVVNGLQDFLAVKTTLDADNRLFGDATTITVNENMEITKIHLAYDVTQ